MPEWIQGTARDCAAISQDPQIVIMSEFAQRDHDLDTGQQIQLSLKIPATGSNFFQGRFVIGWSTVARRSNVGVFELEAVIRATTLGLRRKPGRMKNPVQDVSRAVAVNMRPVRFDPCAPGAKPRMSSLARGSPKEGTGFPQ